MSQTEIAGMSAALNEVSESSERAGTRLRRLGQEMMNPKKADDLASALGMTASEFETMRDEAPNEMLLAMAEAMASGDEQADELKDTLSTTSRQALTGLAQNIDGTRKALEMSSTAYEENTSLQEEFNASADTFNKQLQMLRNRLRNVAIVMGNQILPVLVKAMDAVTPLIDSVADLNERLDGMPALLATVGATLAGLGAVAVSVGPAIVGALSPILGPVAAITAAVGVLYYVWTNDMGGIQDATKEMLDTLQTVFNKVLDVMKAVFEEYVMPLLEELQQVWETEFQKIMNEVVKTMDVIRKKIKVVLRFVRRFWNKHGTKIRKIVNTYFGAIELVIKTTMRAISALIRSILALIRGDFDRVLKIVKNFWTKTFDDILAFLKEDWLPGLKATLRLFSDFIKNIFRKLYVARGAPNLLHGRSTNSMNGRPDFFSEPAVFFRFSVRIGNDSRFRVDVNLRGGSPLDLSAKLFGPEVRLGGKVAVYAFGYGGGNWKHLVDSLARTVNGVPGVAPTGPDRGFVVVFPKKVCSYSAFAFGSCLPSYDNICSHNTFY
jgi:phage-related protein